MGPLGRKIVVYGMVWVLLVMVLSQIYDNVRGTGMPVKQSPVPTAASGATPDAPGVSLADLEKCVASDPGNVQCNTKLAALYYSSQQWPQAQNYYERAVKLEPGNVQHLRKLAGTYIFQQKFDQAMQTLQKAVTLSPGSAEIHLLLGLSLSKLDPPRTAEAIKEWRTAISLSPESPWAKQAAKYISEAGK